VGKSTVERLISRVRREGKKTAKKKGGQFNEKLGQEKDQFYESTVATKIARKKIEHLAGPQAEKKTKRVKLANRKVPFDKFPVVPEAKGTGKARANAKIRTCAVGGRARHRGGKTGVWPFVRN